MHKRTILAVILIALVLFVHQSYVARYYPGVSTVATTGVEADRQIIDTSVQAPKWPEQMPGGLLEKEVYGTPALPAEEVEIETEKYIVTLSSEGGCIKSIALKEYPHPRTNEVFKLVAIEDLEQGIFNMDGLDEGALSKVRFIANKKDREIVFSAQLKNGLEITKRYTFHDSAYHINLELYFYNPTEQTLYPEYSIIAGSNIDIATKLDRRYAQIVSDVAGKSRRDNGKKKEGLFVDGIVKYTGLQNKYFSVITRPSMVTKGVLLRQTDNNNILSSIEIDRFTINPKTSVSHSFLLYAGPTNEDIMEPYDLKSAVSYGFFGGISKILLVGLKLFHRLFKNWGVAIILLSLFVNLLLFPLSRKSYQSMKKMQELQPHMEKLRSEHKDSPQKLNKEMMGLYKKYNVNPMGGCLPMFLQIPVFISLYQALMRSLDLRGARFLWIKDLSMPDAVHLAFKLPLVGNTINILPILMAGAMVFQQKIATQKNTGASAQAKQQQQMMIMMPVLFLFIMYNFPSGLVLYWLTNTLLTMFEQRSIMHR